ncbi:MAG: DUF4403 family protein, partial [Chitinophagales bacterium]
TLPKREKATAIVGFEALSQLLQNKHFEFDGGKQWLDIEYIRFATKGNHLVAESKLSAYVKWGVFSKKLAGIAYIKAVPEYDKASKKLKINDFSYALESTNRLLQFGSRLAQRNLQNFLHEKMEEGANQLLQQLPAFLEREMKHIEVEDYADLKGTLNYFEVEDMSLTDAALYISGKVGTEWVLEVR